MPSSQQRRQQAARKKVQIRDDQAGAAAAPKVSAYTLDLTRHVAIWFNAAHSSEWLPLPIQESLQRKREDNPEATITLVFSSALLSPEAQENLKAFARKYNLTLMDFEAIKIQELNANEQGIYELACMERNAIEQPETVDGPVFMGGGNPASMSHLCRWLLPVRNAGIYSDAGDIHFKTGSHKKIADLKAPILSTLRSVDNDNNFVFENSNNILAFPTPNNPYSRREQNNFIKKVTSKILENYRTPLSTRIESLGEKSSLHFLLDDNTLQPFLESHKSPRVVDLRKWLTAHSQSLYTAMKLRFFSFKKIAKAQEIKENAACAPYWEAMEKAVKEGLMEFPEDFPEGGAEYWKNFFHVVWRYLHKDQAKRMATEEVSDRFKGIMAMLNNPNTPRDTFIQLSLKFTNEIICAPLISEFSGPAPQGLPRLYELPVAPPSIITESGESKWKEEAIQSIMAYSINHADPALTSFFSYKPLSGRTWMPGGRKAMLDEYALEHDASAPILYAHHANSAGGGAKASSKPTISPTKPEEQPPQSSWGDYCRIL